MRRVQFRVNLTHSPLVQYSLHEIKVVRIRNNKMQSFGNFAKMLYKRKLVLLVHISDLTLQELLGFLIIFTDRGAKCCHWLPQSRLLIGRF